MRNVLDSMLSEGDFTIVEEFTLPGRPAVHAPVPRFLYDSRVGLHLGCATGSAGLWRHQATALDEFGGGRNVVVSTGTASGKSLFFQSATFHRLLLDPGAKALVFYPLRALAADQLLSWRSLAEAMEIPESFVGRIDGTVPYKQRDEVLSTARVVLMTPDVCHAWLMFRLATPEAKDFLRRLKLIVLDEAHTLEGVFGSNFAFLFRRIVGARNALVAASERESGLQRSRRNGNNR